MLGGYGLYLDGRMVCGDTLFVRALPEKAEGLRGRFA
jgi:TfoX/Sxy family transcriptional regulator of competence genes